MVRSDKQHADGLQADGAGAKPNKSAQGKSIKRKFGSMRLKKKPSSTRCIRIMSLFQTVCLSICASVCLFVSLSSCLSACLSVFLFVCLSVCLCGVKFLSNCMTRLQKCSRVVLKGIWEGWIYFYISKITIVDTFENFVVYLGEIPVIIFVYLL